MGGGNRQLKQAASEDGDGSGYVSGYSTRVEILLFVTEQN